MIYIGSDHGGFKQKVMLKLYFIKHKIKFVDIGAHTLKKDDDYPVYAKKVAQAVQKDLKNNRGILLCRSGQGVCFAANKFKGIRAVIAWDTKVAKEERKDNDANVLCLPSDFISANQDKEIVKVWLSTPFSKAPRHVRRIKQVDKFK